MRERFNFPFWKGFYERSVIAGEHEGWRDSDALVVQNAALVKKLLETDETQLDRLHYLIDTEYSNNGDSIFIVERAPNLRGLIFDSLISKGTMVPLIVALRHTPHLQQLRCMPINVEGSILIDFIAAIEENLRLTALSFCLTVVSQQEFIARVASRLCAYLERVETLRYLQLTAKDSQLSEEMWTGLAKLPFGIKGLRTLDFREIFADRQLYSQACEMLRKMTTLRCLELMTTHAFVLQLLSGTQYCTLDRLDVFVSGKNADFSDILVFLKDHSRLRHLSISCESAAVFTAFVQSGLIDVGWLTEVRISEDANVKVFSMECARNMKRHRNCNRACIALLFARRNKRCAQLISGDVIPIIARYLWDTRNNSVWYDERVSAE